jgi:hypothetical protein
MSKPFNVSQPQLNSSDRTAHLKSKTKYASAVNLAQNGGVLNKRDGSKYVGPVRTTSVAMTSADSYADLLDVTKGKYLLAPPPSSDLAASFSMNNGEAYYGNFMVTNYAAIPATMLGFPTVKTTPSPPAYKYLNQLVLGTTATTATTVTAFNAANIVIDPEYRLFYGTGDCGERGYLKNVRLDALDVSGSRAYNQQQAQRIIANELRGFRYPARVHLDLENCGSKPSIAPVAPDAPVIYISNQTGTGPYTVTISWLHGFDGGSPITGYALYKNGAVVSIAPQPCLTSYTLTAVSSGDQIWVTASNTLTSGNSNRITI